MPRFWTRAFTSLCARRASGGCDEIDQFFHSAEKRWLNVLEAVYCAEDGLPGPCDVGLFVVWPAQSRTDPVLPLHVARDDRPGRKSQALGFDRLPHVHERVADDQHMRGKRTTSDGVGDAALLRSG